MEFDILNVPKSVPKDKINDYIFLFYAPPKFGKSSFANQFNNPLMLAFEKGYNLLDNVRPVDITDWKFFVKNVIDPLEKHVQDGNKLPYDTIIVDTADECSTMCKEFICKREGIVHESDLDWGKGYTLIKEEFNKQIMRLTKLGCGVFFISHSETKVFKPKGKEEYTKILPSLPKGAREVLLPLCDFILYGDTETEIVNNQPVEKRYLYLRDTVTYEAGCRLRYMPPKIDFGTSPEEAYSNFMDAFKKAFKAEFKVDFKDNKDQEIAEVITSQENQKVVEEPKKETKGKPEKKDDEVKEVKKESNKQEDFTQIIKTIQDETTELYKIGKLTAVQIVDLIKSNTGKDRISSLTEDDLDGCKKLLNALVSLRS